MQSSASIRSWWFSPVGVLLLLGLASGLVAWWMIAAPVAVMANVKSHATHFPLVYLHMVGGTIMLFFGGANLYIGATRRHFKFHKLIGRTYLIGGAIAALLAIGIAAGPAHKKDAAIIFTNVSVSLMSLATAWLAAAAMGLRAARNRRFDSHRDWMIRSYVLAWSFVFCRIASRVPEIGSLGGGEAFIWLSWVAPFLLCEFALQWKAGAR